MTWTRSERLRCFLDRLLAAPAAPDFLSAFGLLADILNRVEDEMSEVPFDPSAWRDDGRLYPPQLDREVRWDQHGERAFRTVRHFVVFGDDGSIRILDATSMAVIATKPGAQSVRSRP